MKTNDDRIREIARKSWHDAQGRVLHWLSLLCVSLCVVIALLLQVLYLYVVFP